VARDMARVVALLSYNSARYPYSFADLQSSASISSSADRGGDGVQGAGSGLAHWGRMWQGIYPVDQRLIGLRCILRLRWMFVNQIW
jgi:hypothetical protein